MSLRHHKSSRVDSMELCGIVPENYLLSRCTHTTTHSMQHYQDLLHENNQQQQQHSILLPLSEDHPDNKPKQRRPTTTTCGNRMAQIARMASAMFELKSMWRLQQMMRNNLSQHQPQDFLLLPRMSQSQIPTQECHFVSSAKNVSWCCHCWQFL